MTTALATLSCQLIVLNVQEITLVLAVYVAALELYRVYSIALRSFPAWRSLIRRPDPTRPDLNR